MARKRMSHAERIIRLEHRLFKQSVKRELGKYDLLSKPSHSVPTKLEQNGGMMACEVGQSLHDIRQAYKLLGVVFPAKQQGK